MQRLPVFEFLSDPLPFILENYWYQNDFLKIGSEWARNIQTESKNDFIMRCE